MAESPFPFPRAGILVHERAAWAETALCSAPAEEVGEALDERVLRAATAGAAERFIVVTAEAHADDVRLPRGRAVAGRAHLRRAVR